MKLKKNAPGQGGAQQASLHSNLLPSEYAEADPLTSRHTGQILLAAKYAPEPIHEGLTKRFGVSATEAIILRAGAEATLLGRQVSYSRRREWYAARQNHPLLTFDKVVPSIDRLEAAGLIQNWKQAPRQPWLAELVQPFTGSCW